MKLKKLSRNFMSLPIKQDKKKHTHEAIIVIECVAKQKKKIQETYK